MVPVGPNRMSTTRALHTNPTAAQWQAQKDRIHNLYRVQDLTHKELAQRMTEIFGCRVTEKMCKDRTTKWGFGKTVKKGEYEAILRDMGESSGPMREGGVWIRGKEVKRRDVERYVKRRKVEVEVDGGSPGAQSGSGSGSGVLAQFDDRNFNSFDPIRDIGGPVSPDDCRGLKRPFGSLTSSPEMATAR